MRGLPLLALLAAGAVALPHRLGASAVKKVGRVPSRRAAPSLSALDASLSALEADVDKLDHAVPKLERVTDFEEAKSEYMAAKLELMQAMYDAAKTKTELAGIEFDPADFTV